MPDAPGLRSVISVIDPFPASLLGLMPNLIATVVISVAAAAVLAPRLGASRWAVSVWLATLLVPLAYTWTPSWGRGLDTCTWGAWPWSASGGPATYEVAGNIALLAPAGAAVWLWPAGELRWTALVIALTMPPVIETVQRWSPTLSSRACQVSDVAYNLLGVIVGFAAAAAILAAGRLIQTRVPHRTETRRTEGH